MKIVTYLVEKQNINADRFIIIYDEIADDCNTIFVTITDEEPTTPPPLHPNLRRKNH
jgi:hypothetical protein